MHEGFCRYFEDKTALAKHFVKNPSHQSSSSTLSKCFEEAQRRINLRQQRKLMNKRPPSPKEPHPDDLIDEVFEASKPPEALEPPPNKIRIPDYPPTTSTANLLGKLNLSMPKPDFLRSGSNFDEEKPELADSGLIRDQNLASRIALRDPRRRKSLLSSSSLPLITSG